MTPRRRKTPPNNKNLKEWQNTLSNALSSKLSRAYERMKQNKGYPFRTDLV